MLDRPSLRILIVMAGQKREARLPLDVPAIHVFVTPPKDVDARDKRGRNGGGCRAASKLRA
jgi:hypothetical protein